MASAFGANMRFALLLCILAILALTAGAPSPSFWGGPDTSDNNSSTSTAEQLRNQYNFPVEILAILSLIGGDIIQKACAQEAGTFPITPVAFSFGWVAYAFSALMSAFSDGSLMPETDIASVVIDVDAGHCRRNESWVLGRLIRDLEIHNKREAFGLGIYFYRISLPVGKPSRSLVDWLVFLGVIALQLALAALPIIYDHQNWRILYVTGAGTLLAFCSGSLSSWKREKYNESATIKARKGRAFALTRGNGHGHVFVITIEGDRVVTPFDLLATIPRAHPEGRSRRLSIGILAVCWIVVLIAVGGMDDDTWILLLVGGVGMLQNVWVAGRTRQPEEHGIPLEHYETVQRDRGVESVLNDAENKLPGLGLALLDHFFPAGVNHDHHWNEVRRNLEQSKAAKRAAFAQSQGGSDQWKHDDRPEDILVFKNKAGRYLCSKEPVSVLAVNSTSHTTHAGEKSNLPREPTSS